jgi:hypothetical protein
MMTLDHMLVFRRRAVQAPARSRVIVSVPAG